MGVRTGDERPRLPMTFGRRPGEEWTPYATRILNAFGLVLLLVVATYSLESLISYEGWGGVIIALVASAAAVAAFASSGVQPRFVWGAALLGVAAVALAIVAAATAKSTPLAIGAVIQMLLLLTAAAVMLRAVITEQEVTFRTILGALSVYLTLGLLFTFLFVATDRFQGGPFFAGNPSLQRGDFVFFSFTTLTTTGYGNLVPAAQPGKLFAGFEMLMGQIFLVTLIAGLVSLWKPKRGQR